MRRAMPLISFLSDSLMSHLLFDGRSLFPEQSNKMVVNLFDDFSHGQRHDNFTALVKIISRICRKLTSSDNIFDHSASVNVSVIFWKSCISLRRALAFDGGLGSSNAPKILALSSLCQAASPANTIKSARAVLVNESPTPVNASRKAAACAREATL